MAIDLAPEQVSRCIAACGIGFMFAPRHHLAMKHVAPVRRELGMATTFNLIGPLTNPAGARHQLIGVADARYVDRIAQAVRMMGNERNLIVHSDDGLDEISTTCPTSVVEVFAGQGFDERYEVTPEQFGMARARLADLAGGDAGGERGPPARRRRRRAGAAPRHRRCSTPARRCTSRRPPAASPRAWTMARAAVASGAARAKLDVLVATTRRLAQETRVSGSVARPRRSARRRPGGSSPRWSPARAGASPRPRVGGRLRPADAGRRARAPARGARAPDAGRPARPARSSRSSPRSSAARPARATSRPDLDAVAQARAYEAAGADAISVLTEPTRFGGSLDDLRAVAAAVDLPVLRKDFIVDRGQVWEAAEAGAAAVLLIVAILSDDRLHDLLLECLDCGLDPLVEVHDLDETRRACRAGCTLVGINNRDLVTLEVDLATTEYLAPALGPCMFPVSESGISTPADACRVALAGARALLVGETLVRTPHRRAARPHRRPQRPGVAGMTRVKVCGLTRAEDVRLAVELGAWAVGFVLAESPRHVVPARPATSRPRPATR